jgi:hypothetical protein
MEGVIFPRFPVLSEKVERFPFNHGNRVKLAVVIPVSRRSVAVLGGLEGRNVHPDVLKGKTVNVTWWESPVWFLPFRVSPSRSKFVVLKRALTSVVIA